MNPLADLANNEAEGGVVLLVLEGAVDMCVEACLTVAPGVCVDRVIFYSKSVNLFV